PAPQQPPKHLFHFIIRYEGDGIIDSNVVEFMKAQLGGQKIAPPVTNYAPTCTPSSVPACPLQVLPGSMSMGAPAPEGCFVPTCPVGPVSVPPAGLSGGGCGVPMSNTGPTTVPVMPMADAPPPPLTAPGARSSSY